MDLDYTQYYRFLKWNNCKCFVYFLCFCIFILQTFALEYNINMFSFPCFILHIFEWYLFVIYCYYLSVCLLLLLKITVSSTKTKRHKISVKNEFTFWTSFYNKLKSR